MRDYKEKYFSKTVTRVIFVVAAFLLLSFVFASGGFFGSAYSDDANTNNATAESTASSSSDESNSKSSVAQNSADNNLGLIKSGTLTVATSPDYPPFAELVGKTVVGFEADIWNELGNRLGLNVDVKSMNFDSIMAGVAGGTQVDIGVAGISITPERAKTVAFSHPYYEADISFAVSGDSDITKDNAKYMLTDTSLVFAVQSGTTAESYVRENYPEARCIAYSNANDCFSAVSADQADVVCSTKAVVSNMLHGTYSDMNIVRNVATGEEYGIALCPENTALLDAVNDALDSMINDGTLARFASNYAISTGSSNIGSDFDTMHTYKCSASVNSDASSEVLAGKATRVTWEGIAGRDEALTSISFTLPNYCNCDFDSTKVTLLSGEDFTERSDVEASITSDIYTVTATFLHPEKIKPGSYFRVELYDVEFNEAGGQQQIEGSYTLRDGQTKSIDDIPYIYARAMNPVEILAENINNSTWAQAWNSNKFCNLFLNPAIFVRSIPPVFNGFLLALAVVICAFPLAVPFGFMFALMRMSRRKILRGIASCYVNIVRGTPLFLQIYIAFFGLPLAGINVPNFLLGLIVLAMNSSAYLCEIIRAGIQSISKGQFEAARSLGMNSRQTFVHVILPQTIARILPTMTSEFILLFKDTSLLASVGVMEVVMYAKTIVASTGSITPYIVAALFYLIITLPLAKIVTNIEARLAHNRTSRTPKKDASDGGSGYETDKEEINSDDQQDEDKSEKYEHGKNRNRVFSHFLPGTGKDSENIDPDVYGSF